MAADAVEAIKEDFLHCSICTNRFKFPKILPCIHSFCQECLEKYVQRLKCTQLPCPICRKVCDLTGTGVKGLQTNFHLVNLGERMDLLGRLDSSQEKSFSCDSCESTNASAYCLECDSKICPKCQNDHKRFPTLRSHSIIPIDEIKHPKYQQALQNATAPFCDEHPTEYLRFYCKTCSLLICRDCTVVQHPKPDHECVEASRQLDKIKRDLLGLLNDSSSDLKGSVEFIKTGKAGSQAVERGYNTLSKEVKNTYDRMMVSIEKQLRSQMEKMCEEISKTKTGQRKMIDEKVNKASSWVKRLENTQEVTKKVIKENNMWEILSMSHDLISAFQVLKFDAEEFQWQQSDLKQVMVFSPHQPPPVSLGKCSAGCDVVLSENNGNFILLSFDRHSSMLQMTRIRKDNGYDWDNADNFPPFKVEAPVPTKAKVSGTFLRNMNCIFVGLGRLILKFNVASHLFENVFVINKDEDSFITFLEYLDASNAVYFMLSNNQSVKQFTDYNHLCNQHTIADNQRIFDIEPYVRSTGHMIPEDHFPIENVIFYYIDVLYSFKESNTSGNSKLCILSKGENAPLIINSVDIIPDRQQLAVFKGVYQGRRKCLDTKIDSRRYVMRDCFTCYILWGNQHVSSSESPSNFIITEYDSGNQRIIGTWNVPEESAKPVSCFKNSDTIELVVCDLYGKVSTCINLY